MSRATLADQARQKLKALDTQRPDKGSELATVRLVRGDAVPLEPVGWLWRGFLPAGMLTLLGGAPGCGKTTIALSLAAVITRGGAWPDGSSCTEPGDVVVWSGEDGASVLMARLRAAGADPARVHLVEGVSDECEFDPGRDMLLLEAAATSLPRVRLLILDPIVSAVAGDSHKGAEVRRSLQPVVTLAQRLGCAVLGITHFSKGTGGRDPVERVTGSIAFAALARLVLVAAKVKADGDDTEPRRVLMRAKANICADDGGFAYGLERVEVAPEVEGQRVRWLEALQGSARELLAEAEAEPDDASDDVAGFLRGVLADGPKPAKAVAAEASGAGYSRDQVQRAARRLGVERRKDGMAGGWRWALPSPEGGSEGSEERAPQRVPPSPSSAAYLPSSEPGLAGDELVL
jgi:putative DNA primase/helicase